MFFTTEDCQSECYRDVFRTTRIFIKNDTKFSVEQLNNSSLTKWLFLDRLLKGAATDMRYFTWSKFSRSLVHKKNFGLI